MIDQRELLQSIAERSKLFERETHLSNDLALILIYDQLFGTKVRGKFKVKTKGKMFGTPFLRRSKGIFKRNQTFLDESLRELLEENQLTSTDELLQLAKRQSRPSVSIPRYVRINLLKTTSKKVRRALKELSYRRLKLL